MAAGSGPVLYVISVPASEVEVHDGKAYIFCDPDSHDSAVGPFSIEATVNWEALP